MTHNERRQELQSTWRVGGGSANYTQALDEENLDDTLMAQMKHRSVSAKTSCYLNTTAVLVQICRNLLL